MITINETLKVPNKLEEISILKGKEIMGILDKSNFKPNTIAKTTIISILANVPFAVIDKIDNEGIDKIYELLPFNTKTIYGRYWDTLVINGELYGRCNMDRLTVKEFAQIMFYLGEGDTPYEYLGEVLSTLYRPVISKNKSWSNILRNIKYKILYRGAVRREYKSYEIEPLNDFHTDKAELFERKLDFNFGYSIVNSLIYNYSEQLKKNYPLLFKVEEEKVEQEVEEEEVKEDTPEFDQIWGLYHQVASISNSLFEREAWFERPLTHFMKYLAYLKQLNAYQKIENNGR